MPVIGPAVLARPGVMLALLLLAGATQAAQVVIDGPAGSGEFGRSVTTLPNGNIVVTDPGFDAPGPIANVGAVYLYRPDGTLISALRGSSANDQVGSGGVVPLTNGNYVVRSPNWDAGPVTNVGAVTFGSGTAGISGVVAPTNSLVGGVPGDQVGNAGVTALTNGNYVVRSPNCDVGPNPEAGAVTFGSGTSGVSGVVNATNSLVGSSPGNLVGSSGVTALSNGNYVVVSSFWDAPAASDVGAVTFGSGTAGITGAVSSANSLVGSTTGDRVGDSGVTALANGNYVVISPIWDNGAIVNVGAVTFGSGTSGVAGVVSTANSLVGSSGLDQVGTDRFGVTALTNGNYVVRSLFWDNGAINDAGAATFGSGTTGVSGVVSTSNSLVGSRASDSIGTVVTALANGDYLVGSPFWDNGATVDVGALTYGSGATGITGVISPVSALVGSTAGDAVGSLGVIALTNGNYVVFSPIWDNGANPDVGAVTFGSGASGVTGVVSPANSLIGSTTLDQVGSFGGTALANGNYVVISPTWINGAASQAGAVTFGSGTTGITGVVSPINSLVGSAADDRVGLPGVIALTNGSYVARSFSWANGTAIQAGAVTFGSGASGISGVVSSTNSLVGSAAVDRVGESDVVALPNGNYVVRSPLWDNGAIANAGAITLGLSNGSVSGAITSTHSVLGSVANQGSTQTFSYDASRNQLAVGQPASNRIVLHRTGIATSTSIVGDTPDPSIGGQPVTFTATVTATPSGPTDGQVTFTASSGQSCVDTTPTATSPTTATYACTITFTANSVSTVIAEYTGSIIHAYSGSGPETHTTIVDAVFANGFEGP